MIAVCPNPFRDLDCRITRDIIARLEAAGFKTCVCPLFLEEGAVTLPADMKATKLSTVAENCQMVVVVGGDGTILAAARQLHNTTVPILGVNLGTKGFMTTLEQDELDQIIPAVKGQMSLSCRMKLDVSVIREGKLILEDSALNDAVMHGYGDCIKMTVYCNGDRITQFSGDGIILATPTGSTGYSMSAGGPIVEPDAENIIISPICPHSTRSSSYVLDPSHVIRVIATDANRKFVYLSSDGGKAFSLKNEDVVQASLSKHTMKLVRLSKKSFCEILDKKMAMEAAKYEK